MGLSQFWTEFWISSSAKLKFTFSSSTRCSKFMSMTWWGNKRWLWTRIDCVDGRFWMRDYGKVFIWNFLDLESGNSFATFKNGFNEPQWYILKYPFHIFQQSLLKVFLTSCGYPQKVPTLYQVCPFGHILLVCL